MFRGGDGSYGQVGAGARSICPSDSPSLGNAVPSPHPRACGQRPAWRLTRPPHALLPLETGLRIRRREATGGVGARLPNSSPGPGQAYAHPTTWAVR